MKIIAENDRLINELKIELSNSKDYIVKRVEIAEDENSDKRDMGDISTYLELYNNATTALINTTIIISAIVAFVKKYFPEFEVYIRTKKNDEEEFLEVDKDEIEKMPEIPYEITAIEYLEMSDNAKKAIEKAFKEVIIK